MMPGGQIRAAIRAAKTIATKVSPAFARTPLATGGTPNDGSQQAPVYYSALQEGLANAKQQSATPQDWKNILPKLGKQDEIDATGANDFLDQQQGQVPKQALMQHVAQNVPQINEVWKGAGVTQNKGFSGIEGMRPKHPTQVLPGGTNYKELLMTLPVHPDEPKPYDIKQEGGQYRVYPRGTRDWISQHPSYEQADKSIGARHLRESMAGISQNNFKSSHWSEPNVLVHARMNDRRDAQGRKLLHIEEIQSDWHQKGREEGYKSTGPRKYYQIHNSQSGNRSQEFDTLDQARVYHRALPDYLKDQTRIMEHHEPLPKNDQRPPDAPFKDTKDWTGLMMKRLIRHAADNGYHGITWTTGDQQADRYDLGKQLRGVIATKHAKGYNLRGIENDDAGTYHDFGSDIPEEKLAQHVGKDLAEKISKQAPGQKRYQGVDLKVGGEGMRGYYDNIVSSVAAKLGKEHGVKPGMIDLPAQKKKNLKIETVKGPLSSMYKLVDYDQEHPDYPGEMGRVIERSPVRGDIEAALKQFQGPDSMKVHYMPITPSMKGKPQKMFKRGGIVRPKLDTALNLANKHIGR